MSTIGFTSNPSHIRQAGIATWAIMAASDAKHYDLGPLKDGKVVVSPLVEVDTKKRQFVHAIGVEFSAKMLHTHKTNVIPTLMYFGTTLMNHSITGVNTMTFVADMGTSWKLVIEGGLNSARHIEIKADTNMLVDHATYKDLTNLLTDTETNGVPSNDSLALLANVTSARTPGGIYLFQVRPTADTVFETLGVVRNGKFNAESVGLKDEFGRTYNYGVKIHVEIEMMQTSTELQMLKSALDCDFKLTFAGDGAICSLDNILGIQWQIENANDSEDAQLIKVSGDGVMPIASWSGLWS